MNYVIVGAGPAGVIAAETLRKNDPDGDIALIGDEGGAPYSRMAIPYFLSGKIPQSGMRLRPDDDHYQRLGVRTITGRVAALDTGAGYVALEGGESVPFDKLLLATGSRAANPPIKGLDIPGVEHCWTAKDAEAIVRKADKGARVVLIGAGFIGCIILESLALRGVDLTVIEAADRMVPLMTTEAAGSLIKTWCERQGVSVLTRTQVREIARDGAGLSVHLDQGAPISADLVVVATGVRANMDFLADGAVATDVGIIVNDRLQTNVSGIYAAGDVAQGPDFSGGRQVHPIQPTAVEHGRIAALNMVGKDVRYQGSLMMNVLDTLGLVSVSSGNWKGGPGLDVGERIDEEAFRYMRLVFDGDVLVGGLSLGRTDMVGVLRGLIQAKTSLGSWKERLMTDPTLIGAAYVACTKA